MEEDSLYEECIMADPFFSVTSREEYEPASAALLPCATAQMLAALYEVDLVENSPPDSATVKTLRYELAAMKKCRDVAQELTEHFLKKWQDAYQTIAMLRDQLAAMGSTSHVVAQTVTPDVTYTVFATNPSTVQINPQHTPADVKQEAAPKPIPAAALRTSKTDSRMIRR